MSTEQNENAELFRFWTEEELPEHLPLAPLDAEEPATEVEEHRRSDQNGYRYSVGQQPETVIEGSNRLYWYAPLVILAVAGIFVMVLMQPFAAKWSFAGFNPKKTQTAVGAKPIMPIHAPHLSLNLSHYFVASYRSSNWGLLVRERPKGVYTSEKGVMIDGTLSKSAAAATEIDKLTQTKGEVLITKVGDKDTPTIKLFRQAMESQKSDRLPLTLFWQETNVSGALIPVTKTIELTKKPMGKAAGDKIKAH